MCQGRLRVAHVVLRLLRDPVARALLLESMMIPSGLHFLVFFGWFFSGALMACGDRSSPMAGAQSLDGSADTVESDARAEAPNACESAPALTRYSRDCSRDSDCQPVTTFSFCSSPPFSECTALARAAALHYQVDLAKFCSSGGMVCTGVCANRARCQAGKCIFQEPIADSGADAKAE